VVGGGSDCAPVCRVERESRMKAGRQLQAKENQKRKVLVAYPVSLLVSDKPVEIYWKPPTSPPILTEAEMVSTHILCRGVPGVGTTGKKTSGRISDAIERVRQSRPRYSKKVGGEGVSLNIRLGNVLASIRETAQGIFANVLPVSLRGRADEPGAEVVGNTHQVQEATWQGAGDAGKLRATSWADKSGLPVSTELLSAQGLLSRVASVRKGGLLPSVVVFSGLHPERMGVLLREAEQHRILTYDAGGQYLRAVFSLPHAEQEAVEVAKVISRSMEQATGNMFSVVLVRLDDEEPELLRLKRTVAVLIALEEQAPGWVKRKVEDLGRDLQRAGAWVLKTDRDELELLISPDFTIAPAYGESAFTLQVRRGHNVWYDRAEGVLEQVKKVIAVFQGDTQGGERR